MPLLRVASLYLFRSICSLLLSFSSFFLSVSLSTFPFSHVWRMHPSSTRDTANVCPYTPPPKGAAKKQALDKSNNVALKGNTVLFGQLVGVVFATGARTVMGQTKNIFANRPAPPRLPRGADKKKVLRHTGVGGRDKGKEEKAFQANKSKERTGRKKRGQVKRASEIGSRHIKNRRREREATSARKWLAQWVMWRSPSHSLARRASF